MSSLSFITIKSRWNTQGDGVQKNWWLSEPHFKILHTHLKNSFSTCCAFYSRLDAQRKPLTHSRMVYSTPWGITPVAMQGSVTGGVRSLNPRLSQLRGIGKQHHAKHVQQMLGTVKSLTQAAPNPQIWMCLACSCLCTVHSNQMLSWEWKCSWSSTDRRCSNYIWVVNNLIAN